MGITAVVQSARRNEWRGNSLRRRGERGGFYRSGGKAAATGAWRDAGQGHAGRALHPQVWSICTGIKGIRKFFKNKIAQKKFCLKTKAAVKHNCWLKDFRTGSEALPEGNNGENRGTGGCLLSFTHNARSGAGPRPWHNWNRCAHVPRSHFFI